MVIEWALECIVGGGSSYSYGSSVGSSVDRDCVSDACSLCMPSVGVDGADARSVSGCRSMSGAGSEVSWLGAVPSGWYAVVVGIGGRLALLGWLALGWWV